MPTFRIVSPERRWRAASLVLIAAWVAWRGFRYAGPGQYAGPVVGCLVAAGLLAWVIPVMRTCLVVTEQGLIDRRAVRSVRVAWLEITELRVARPGGLWGGFCVVASCRDGSDVDLLSRTIGDGPSAWELLLPPEVLRLPGELARVDALLDDPAFFAPFAPHFHPLIGRPCTPIECYLRLMFLKFRYRLGYQSLCAEVSDSISWRRFCRIPLDGRVPHPTTLMKLTGRCGSAAVAGLNEALLAKAGEVKLLRTARLRADTTVIPANVSYPTDSGLLARAIRRIAAAGRRIQAAGGATRTRVRDRSRAAGRRAHAIAAKLRSRAAQAREEKQAVVLRMTGELAGLAERAAREARRMLDGGRRALRRAAAKAAALAAAGVRDAAAGRRRGRLRRAADDLAGLLKVTTTIAAQARQRLAGDMPDGASRQVSLHDADARPIAKGRLGKPVEFGYKAQVTDNDDGDL